MAAETLLLYNGAVANGDLSSNPNPNPNPTKKSRDTERRRRLCRTQKMNSKASHSSDADDDDSKDPQQGECGIEKQPFQLPDFIAATGIEKIT